MALKTSEKGNAFVLILLGVVLFGALIMTLTRSGQQSITPMTKQQAKIAAQDILSYARLVEQTVNKLRRKGCSENQFDFGNTEWLFTITGNNIISPNLNPNSPVDESCHLFSPNGGKLSADVIQLAAANNSTLNPVSHYMPGSGHVLAGPILNVGTSEAELWFQINLIDEQVCEEINKQLELNFSTIPIETAIAGELIAYYGAFPSPPLVAYGDDAPELEGKTNFCMGWSPSGWATNNIVYYYVHVLIAR